MKKNVFLIAIISMFLFSVGCKSSGNDPNDVVTGVNNSSAAQYISSVENIYESGMIYGSPKKYLDFETMEKSTLCTKPNCTHTTSDCIANIIGDTPIIHNGYIYYFDVIDGVNETNDGREFFIDSKLKRVSLSSSEIEVISEFTDCEPHEGSGCVIVGDTLYFCGDDMDPTENEYGVIFYSSVGGTHYLCSVDLNTGEYTNYGSVYDGDKQYDAAHNSSSAHITGCYDSKLYIEYSFVKEKEMLIPNTDDNNDERDHWTVLNFEYDLETQKLEESNLPSASFINEDTYLCSNYPDNSSTLIYNGETYILDGVDVDIWGKFYNGKVFMYDYWYDVNDQSKHSLGEYEGWRIKNFYDGYYIFFDSINSKFFKLTEEELLAL